MTEEIKTTKNDASVAQNRVEVGVVKGGVTDLNIECEIRNLLPGDLRIVDANGQVRATFAASEPAMIRWVPMDVEVPAEGWEELMREARDHHPYVSVKGDTDGKLQPEMVCGTVNSIFDLVMPEDGAAHLLEFWRKCAWDRHACTAGLPDVKDLQGESKYPLASVFLGAGALSDSNLSAYCVVSRGVAMLAFLEHKDISQLLLPALPMTVRDVAGEVMTDGKGNALIGYQALMLASDVLKGARRD